MITLGAVALGWVLQSGFTVDKGDSLGFPGDGAVAENAHGVHDPTVFEFKGKYFCFCTSGNSFGNVRSSDDLKSWKVLGPVLPETPEWLTKRYRHRSIWAPDVFVQGDRLRMYYCASNFGTNESVIGMAECSHFDPSRPLEGWRDAGLVIESVKGQDFFNAIDPKVVSDGDRLWMFFGSYFAGIHLIELDPVSGKLKSPDAKPVCIAKNTSERGNPLEASTVCKRGDYFYLFVSYGLAAQGIRSTYRIMMGRSKSIEGPFEDRNGVSMFDGGHESFLKSSVPMFGPGGQDVFKDQDGRYLLAYHFYDGRHYWQGGLWGLPTLQVREILWSADGWPLPGLPVEALVKQKLNPDHSLLGKWIHQADFAEPKTIVFAADGTVVDGEAKGRWERHGDNLRLQWPRRDAPGEFWVDELQLAYADGYYVGRNKQGLVIRGVHVHGDMK